MLSCLRVLRVLTFSQRWKCELWGTEMWSSVGQDFWARCFSETLCPLTRPQIYSLLSETEITTVKCCSYPREQPPQNIAYYYPHISLRACKCPYSERDISAPNSISVSIPCPASSYLSSPWQHFAQATGWKTEVRFLAGYGFYFCHCVLIGVRVHATSIQCLSSRIKPLEYAAHHSLLLYLVPT